ncbi:MAG: hypothetical protein ACK51Q_00625 [Betaproteobacteria bacterium]
MTRKRSRYRPRGVNPTAHLVAIQGVAWISRDDQTLWALAIDDAVRAVARGQASQAQWRDILDAVNLGEQLVIMRTAHDPGRIVQAAQDACVAILDRQRETGVRAARASELAALHELRAGWVELRSGITQAERFAAGEAVQHRVRRALAGAEPAARLVQPLEQEPA